MRLGDNGSTRRDDGGLPAALGEQLGQRPGARGDDGHRAPNPSSSAASERSTAVHEGSIPTMGTGVDVDDRPRGLDSASTVRPRILRAASS